MATTAADERTVTSKLGATFVPFPQKAAQPPKAPSVSFDDYYKQWTKLATTKGGATKAAPPIVSNDADSIYKPHLSKAGKEVELREKILTGTAVGLAQGFGQEMWYPDQHLSSMAAALVADPLPEQQRAPIPMPRSAKHGEGGGGGGRG